MTVAAAISALVSLDPRVAAATVAKWGTRLIMARYRNVMGRGNCSYPALSEDVQPQPPQTPRVPAALLMPLAGNIHAMTSRIMAHRFDLLGSGWVSASYGATAPGFEGHVYPAESPERGDLTRRLTPGNRERASSIRNLIDGGFTPIDWQRDLRSGYRWREDTLSACLVYGHKAGVDVKSPWELARLQHLPWLVWAFLLSSAGESGFAPRELYLREFRNQVLDFWAANPPGYGVNWMCTMDVAIRAANIALAYDLFRVHGVGFDTGFTAEMDALMRAHGHHVVDNLEWHPKRRANHYLANIAGLAFITAQLPQTDETDRWLAFSVQELVAETDRQFLPDGANFEGSTSYHRMSAEMVAYATALIVGLPAERRKAFADYNHVLWTAEAPLHPGPLRLHTLPNESATQGPFPASHFRKMEKMADFSAHITKPNGRVIQIGDNDSGHFVKVAPTVELIDGAVREVHLDHRGLVGAINGLFGRPDRADFAGAAGALESHLTGGLARTRMHSYREAGQSAAAANVGMPFKDVPLADKHRPTMTTTIRLPDPSALDDLHLCRYSDFGIYILASKRVFLAVRCGRGDHDGGGGHSHNDQLAVELNVDGEDWLADPGTYVYTANVRARNAYRSAAAHAVPRWKGREPSPLNKGTFRLPDEARAACLGFDPEHFVGVHHGFGFPMVRTVAVEDGAIVITDTPSEGSNEHDYATVHSAAELRAQFGVDTPFSPGYGWRNAEAQKKGDEDA